MAKKKKANKDRILYNPGRRDVDEVVCHKVTVHMEQLDDDKYWIGISRGDDHIAINLFVDGPANKKQSLKAIVNDNWQWDKIDEHEG